MIAVPQNKDCILRREGILITSSKPLGNSRCLKQFSSIFPSFLFLIAKFTFLKALDNFPSLASLLKLFKTVMFGFFVELEAKLVLPGFYCHFEIFEYLQNKSFWEQNTRDHASHLKRGMIPPPKTRDNESIFVINFLFLIFLWHLVFYSFAQLMPFSFGPTMEYIFSCELHVWGFITYIC